jgi:hypothetical protein
MLEVEIYYYHAAEPISIPLPGYDQATAESYLERLKRDVIEAQRHGQNRLLISPFGRRTHAQAVTPSEILRVVLVGRPSINHATDSARAGKETARNRLGSNRWWDRWRN